MMFRKLNRSGVSIPAATITLDDTELTVDADETIAAVLLRTPSPIARSTPISGTPRAPFCLMGVCFECLVEVDGVSSVRSCVTRVCDGMTIRRQLQRPDPMRERV